MLLLNSQSLRSSSYSTRQTHNNLQAAEAALWEAKERIKLLLPPSSYIILSGAQTLLGRSHSGSSMHHSRTVSRLGQPDYHQGISLDL